MALALSLRALLLTVMPCTVLAHWRVDGHNPVKALAEERRGPNRRNIQKRDVSGDYQYLTDKTQKYLVNGTDIPFVDWDLGESYAGLMPISKKSNETRELFFWLNGGPGCSSFIGLVQENGPFTWFPSAYRPVYNIYSWSLLSNMLYVDQPAGTGFSVGSPDATTEEEIA
ncbi:hypothetical protein COL922a_008133 [Colletotrichum nupharicola]|nr:hypothetical protein COL922a_008133 [Colletotrichum nupharicola]